MKRLALAGVAVALVCGACGSALSPVSAPSRPWEGGRLSPHLKSVVRARVHAAELGAESLLDRIPLPVGARPTRNAPAILRTAVSRAGVWVRRHRFWRLREPLASVRHFMARHPVDGYENDQGGSEYGGRVSDVGFDPSPGSRLSGSDYFVTLTRRHGWTFVLAGTEASWDYPRSPREVVPAGVREIDIAGANVDQSVTSTSDVEQIVRWFDRIPVVQPQIGGAGGCPGPTYRSEPVDITFTFRAAGRAPVATAVVPSAPGYVCWGSWISFAIRGTAQRSLADDPFYKHAFVNRVQRLLGVCFSHSTRSCR